MAQTAKGKVGKTDWKQEVLRTFAQAANRNDSGILNFEGMPEWAGKAFFECFKVVFPGGRLPPMEKWSAENLGVFFGRLKALESVCAGEVPLGPEPQAELDRLKAMVESQPPVRNLSAIQKDFETQYEAVHEAIPVATAMADASTYSEALDFQKGLALGMKIEPDELATSRTFRRHTRTFWVLALYWRSWAKCRSVREVYEHLCKAVGEKKIGSFKAFENHVAKPIGLKVRGRGRPKAVR